MFYKVKVFKAQAFPLFIALVLGSVSESFGMQLESSSVSSAKLDKALKLFWQGHFPESGATPRKSTPDVERKSSFFPCSLSEFKTLPEIIVHGQHHFSHYDLFVQDELSR